MESSTCLDCGEHIGMYYDAFVYMREILLTERYKKSGTKVHIDNKFIDSTLNEDLTPIFNALNINRYCCRAKITTAKSMSDLEY
jgi:DNA-directed RNA polymerase subunit N (RpoN/RPB10)